MNQELPKVSVVIATLGGKHLANTIATINTGVLTPSEILICIPEELSARVSGIRDSNLRVIRTPFRGQVAQRAEGFKQASEPLVLQLDDDIDMQPDTLLLLAKSIEKLGEKNVAGPVFLNKVTGDPLSPFAIGLKGQLVSLYCSIFGALPWGQARMGCLSSICTCSSIDPRFCTHEVVKTQWLAGGCVLGYRDDLIKENFFPFEGKSYAEDCLHSFLRAGKGITHHVVIAARASIDEPSNCFLWRDFVHEMRVRLAIVKIMQGSLARKWMYIGAEAVRRMIWRRKFDRK